MSQRELINILVVGDDSVGKSTLINSYMADYSTNVPRTDDTHCNHLMKIESECLTNYEGDIFLNFIDTQGYKNSNNCLQNLHTMSINIDVFFAVYDMKMIKEKNYKLELVNDIKSLINAREYGYLFVIVNKCDEYILNEKGFVDKECKEMDDFIVSLRSCLGDAFDNIILLSAHNAYLHRYLYYSNNNDLETIKEIDNIVKLQIGERVYKKMKDTLLTLKDKRNFLDKKFDLDDIYENVMTESGYTYFLEKIDTFISSNFQTIRNRHIKNDINELKTNNDLINVISELKKIIVSINSENKEIYENIESFINSDKFNERIVCLLKSPKKILTTVINDVSEIDALIFKKWGRHLLKDQIHSLKTVRNENLIDIFKFSFDKTVLDEIKSKVTVEILYESLNNSVKNMKLLEYFSVIKSIANIMDYDVNYIAVTSLFITNFANTDDHIVNRNIVIKNTIEKILVEETNSAIRFILLNLLYSIDSRIDMSNRILLCNYEEFNRADDAIILFHRVVKEIFDEQKYKNIDTISDVKNYILSLDEKYKNISSLSSFIKKISCQCESVIESLQLVDKCHKGGALYTLLDAVVMKKKEDSESDSDSEKNTKNKKKVSPKKKEESDSDDDSEMNAKTKKKVVTVAGKKR